MARSHTYQLADLLLADHGGVETFIGQRRARNVPWRQIGQQLAAETAGRVNVTEVTLRKWFADTDSESGVAS